MSLPYEEPLVPRAPAARQIPEPPRRGWHGEALQFSCWESARPQHMLLAIPWEPQHVDGFPLGGAEYRRRPQDLSAQRRSRCSLVTAP